MVRVTHDTKLADPKIDTRLGISTADEIIDVIRTTMPDITLTPL